MEWFWHLKTPSVFKLKVKFKYFILYYSFFANYFSFSVHNENYKIEQYLGEVLES